MKTSEVSQGAHFLILLVMQPVEKVSRISWLLLNQSVTIQFYLTEIETTIDINMTITYESQSDVRVELHMYYFSDK